jgi:leucyl-tRNA synthetase
MEYHFNDIEKKWQKYWAENKTFKAVADPNKPKYYVLDMFPYPSGAGLHVGHPLGYIASDIFARFKRHQGFNVLHPMGYDAFGLPAEQYAIQTGTHPAVTTEKNIKRYRQQLDQIGFSFDWDREVRTSDPAYYKWTQWTFIQLFKHWFNRETQKASPIETLIRYFEQNGSEGIPAAADPHEPFTAQEWQNMTEKKQQELLMCYRLAYLSDTVVNWCPALGTVLANDEVKDGFSERGGHPVERKKMRQWSLRISAYAQRLLDGLEHIQWSDSIKDFQRNWIGRSEGATVYFDIKNHETPLEVFTTRPDTLFGATFMVLAPEHEMVDEITASEHQEEVNRYVRWAKNRSERDRMSEVKKVTGVFTGAFGINPLNGKEIPVWIADYVLSGYGSGAIMAVPGHDSRDFAFAKHFGLPIIQVVAKEGEAMSDPAGWETSYDAKEGRMVQSDFLNGMPVKEAITATIQRLEAMQKGTGTINYRLRDAIFSRQRYWGEPFPVYYKNGIPYPLDESELPLELPEVDEYKPTEKGEPPLARAKNWVNKDGYPLEVNTMPGFAGSSAYYYRYMDPHNNQEYFSKEAIAYWKDVDLYMGGDEHATGHLIYARFWSLFLYDLGLTVEEEPFKRLINQGKIQGRSSFVYRVNPEKYAEYLLWQEIKDRKLGAAFKKEFKDGHRRFDFYSDEARLIIEIKTQDKLEKLKEMYVTFAEESRYKLLLIPVRDIINDREAVNEVIRSAIRAEKITPSFEHDYEPMPPIFVSKNIDGRKFFATPIHVDINLVNNDVLDIDGFKKWRSEYADARFLTEAEGKYLCGYEVEKMSKSKYNVQNPDDLIARYGADTFRLYEMFLGPIETHKPWDTQGIEGVFRFMKKFWKLFFDEQKGLVVNDDKPDAKELKVLHQTIQKVTDDMERFSFNTTVSQFMICTNELHDLKCHKRAILEPLVVLISPFAPHMAEEIWQHLGHEGGISRIPFPEFKPEYVQENTFEYPVSFNGKMRFKLELPVDMPKQEAEKAVLTDERAEKYLQGKKPGKIIVVPRRIINVVV